MGCGQKICSHILFSDLLFYVLPDQRLREELITCGRRNNCASLHYCSDIKFSKNSIALLAFPFLKFFKSWNFINFTRASKCNQGNFLS